MFLAARSDHLSVMSLNSSASSSRSLLNFLQTSCAPSPEECTNALQNQSFGMRFEQIQEGSTCVDEVSYVAPVEISTSPSLRSANALENLKKILSPKPVVRSKLTAESEHGIHSTSKLAPTEDIKKIQSVDALKNLIMKSSKDDSLKIVPKSNVDVGKTDNKKSQIIQNKTTESKNSNLIDRSPNRQKARSVTNSPLLRASENPSAQNSPITSKTRKTRSDSEDGFFAGSAILNSPNPEVLPLPDFEESMSFFSLPSSKILDNANKAEMIGTSAHINLRKVLKMGS